MLPGVELLFRDSLHLVSNRRVGLITNPTGTDAQGRSTIDRLYEHPDVALTTLFAPEHGLRATEGEGQRIEDSRDPATGLPVVSLYAGSKRAPSAADLHAIDVLVFDMQDVGARYYTYVYTMSLAMEAAGDAGIPFVVLDRPNPIGLAVQGNVLDPAFATFVGLHPVPMRHGMTAGELARLFRGAFGVEVDLSVVPVEGWDPAAGYEATGLEWIPPSPNMPSVASALHYPGTCLFEGTNLSVGRGTDRPFQQVGAPWLDADSLAARLTRRNLPGVEVLPVRFVPRDPSDGKWADRELEGVRLRAVDPGAYDPTLTSLAVLVEARAMAGEAWEWNVAHFDRLAGTDRLRADVEAGEGVDALHRSWAADREAFESLADPYRLYPR
ncbi:MAG: DUF1343 domain-containing protein [Gemmatimonadetes bacterium]|nr:DUF1343 domain-containing protein [Gemmatimonadota bacterium]